MDPIINYIKYSKGLIKRSKKIGFFNMLKEFVKYYKKFSKLPIKMGFKPDWDYRLYVIYNYIKISYFIWDETVVYVMKFVPRRIQKFLLPKINPLQKKHIVVNKVDFYRLAKKNGLSVPKTFFYTHNNRFYSLDGTEIELSNLKLYEGRTFFSKIIDGSAAIGAKKEEFLLSNIDLKEDRIFQEPLSTHNDILLLSPTKALNCVKISSYYTKNEKVKIQLAFLKLGGENSIVDNIGGKSGGGIAIPVDLNSGQLGDIGYKEVGKELRVSIIRSTGKSFKGFKVPFFKEAIELVLKAHKNVFSELKHLGWDVGITNHGPVLIEANSGADMFAAQMICRPFNYYDDDLIQENLIHLSNEI